MEPDDRFSQSKLCRYGGGFMLKVILVLFLVCLGLTAVVMMLKGRPSR